MEERFDELTREIAEGMTRREALRKTGGLMAGTLLAALGLGSQAVAAVIVGGQRQTAAGSCPGGQKRCRKVCCRFGEICTKGVCL